jgi:hypothetical protein
MAQVAEVRYDDVETGVDDEGEHFAVFAIGKGPEDLTGYGPSEDAAIGALRAEHVHYDSVRS